MKKIIWNYHQEYFEEIETYKIDDSHNDEDFEFSYDVDGGEKTRRHPCGCNACYKSVVSKEKYFKGKYWRGRKLNGFKVFFRNDVCRKTFYDDVGCNLQIEDNCVTKGKRKDVEHCFSCVCKECICKERRQLADNIYDYLSTFPQELVTLVCEYFGLYEGKVKNRTLLCDCRKCFSLLTKFEKKEKMQNCTNIDLDFSRYIPFIPDNKIIEFLQEKDPSFNFVGAGGKIKEIILDKKIYKGCHFFYLRKKDDKIFISTIEKGKEFDCGTFSEDNSPLDCGAPLENKFTNRISFCFILYHLYKYMEKNKQDKFRNKVYSKCCDKKV